MKRFLSLFVFVFVLQPFYSQDGDGGLLQQLKSQKDDSTKVNLYNELSSKLYSKEPDSAIYFAKKGAKLAKSLKFNKGLGYSYKNIGLGYYVKGEYQDALLNWEKSLSIFQSIDYKSGISNLQSNIGAFYQTKGDDPNALRYFINSMRIATEIQDTTRMATVYLNMGTVYSNEKGTYAEALESYEKAKTMFDALNYREGSAVSSLNIGELLIKQDKPREALAYLQQAKSVMESINGNLSAVLQLEGEAYRKLGELTKAERILTDAVRFADERDSKMEKTMALIELGKTKFQKNQFSRSIAIFEDALEITKTTEVLRDKREAYEGLAEAYSKMGNYEAAFIHQKLYSETRDMIRDEQYEETLGNLRFSFDLETKEQEIELLNTENQLKETQIANEENSRKLLYALLAFLGSVIVGFILQYRYVKKSHKRLDKERNRSERILLNILPKETADELKLNGSIKAKSFDSVTVLFTDFKEFSVIAEYVSPERLVRSVDYYFKKFDEIIDNHNLEKIKTIGDAYMCAGGLPSVNTTHPEDALRAAIEIMEFVTETEKNPPEDIHPFKVRIGLNTGQVIAGVVGTKKFQYDIWGNSVNVAARMESNSEPGRINVSENTYELLKDQFNFSYRGALEVKNKKQLKMYYLEEPIKAKSA